MYGNRSSISSAPYYAGAEKMNDGKRLNSFFQDAPDWLLDSFRVVELDKKCCIYQRKSASRYRTHYCEGDV